MRFAVLLAHQGGWDEILLVGGPVAIFAFLLSIARKRAIALAEPGTDGEGATPADEG
jgi:hypothetical protein